MSAADFHQIENFSALTELPDDISLSSRGILEPALLIKATAEGNCARLAAKVMSGGIPVYIEAPSLRHNWVLDGNRIKPLPRDMASVVAELMTGIDPSQLTLPDILRLRKDVTEHLLLDIDPAVFETANDESKKHLENINVPGLNATLYPYQAQGVSWMRETLSKTGGVILADEMGLGKTMQIISLFLLDPPGEGSPALIVCPTTLIANWCQELEKFGPSLNVMIHRGPYRTGLYWELMREQIVITTYETLVNDLSVFAGVGWSFVVCDEAQAIRNPQAQRREAAARLQRKYTIPVTGTPVETSLLDLWSLCDFAIPGLLGSSSEFTERYPETEESAERLAEITNPMILKRQVKGVKDDLPKRTDVNFPLELGDLASDYERIRQETLAAYPQAGGLVATGQLSIFCAHPWLRSDDFNNEGWEDRVALHEQPDRDLETPKIEVTIRLLREAFHNNRKVLIFANYNKCGDLIRRALGSSQACYWAAINGSTPQEDRQPIVDAFTEYNGPGALILNPRAAGSGLNITAATIVIHFTQYWNPALEAQASARAHRIGQSEPVTIYHLYYKDTVEEVMCERSENRRMLAETAVPVTGEKEKTDLAKALNISPLPK